MSDTDTTAAYGESWYAATRLDEPRRPRLAVDLDTDVCVIGGGLAGLTAAREIARSGWSVVLLEARRIASGASGRNTGFVLPGFAADTDALIGRVGFDRAKSLWALAQAGLDYVRNAVTAEGAVGIHPEDGWLHISKTDNGDDFVRDLHLLNDLGCEVEGWPTDRVRAVLRSERYFHAIHYLKAVSIHPLNYALSLAVAAEAAGARIFENTPALSIDPAGVRKRIVTPVARLRANHVVLAGNVQIKGLMPRIGATLIPLTVYLITTAPLGPKLHDIIGYRGAVSDTDYSDNHYRIVGGDRLMLSGRSTAWARNPRRYVRALQADIRSTYPQLGKVDVDYAWSGTLGNTVHRMPQIGELGPGVWLASGFGGHGLNTTAMAGNLIARAIVDGDQTWREFTPFELVWAGGTSGRAAVQIRNWIRRYRERYEQRRAKARELAQIAAREAEAAAAVARAEAEARAQEEARAREEARLLEEARMREEEARLQEEARVREEEARVLEELRLQEEARLRDEARIEEELQAQRLGADEARATERLPEPSEVVPGAMLDDVPRAIETMTAPEPEPPLTGAPRRRRRRKRRENTS